MASSAPQVQIPTNIASLPFFQNTARITSLIRIHQTNLTQGAQLLNGLQKANRFKIGLGEKLPAAYRKFWTEWKLTEPTAVHYVPRGGQFERNERTGIVTPVQNVPIPVIYPPEHNDGLWGGEGVVKGFQKRGQTTRRVPHYWVPVLRRTVVHSRVLDRYMSMVVTDRTMTLIHESHGFDHYLLKTPACDLKSELALQLKRHILHALQQGCKNVDGLTAEKREALVKEYGPYLQQYTDEEIEWYGLTFREAIRKVKVQLAAQEKIVPHKVLFRSKLLEQLREAGVKEAQTGEAGDASSVTTAIGGGIQTDPK